MTRGELILLLLVPALTSVTVFGADTAVSSSSGFVFDAPASTPAKPVIVGPTATPAVPPVVTPKSDRPGISAPRPLPREPQPAPRPQQPDGSSRFEKTCKGAICKPFYQAFKSCEQDCEPTNYGAHRDSPGSCHSQSRAFDLMGMACKVNGKLKNFTAFTPRYFAMVACIKNKHKRTVPYIIWQTTDHYDHAHFSVGCNIDGGKRW